ncbi:MAG: DUF1275 domain-containing protein [Aliidiomarina sp.]|uniref:YoaK family protein n=1 Tax=Aliidiomarina sp. TaxID=1872439 RepID=UPI0025C49C37|nr:YoaK family protein [Aliidiomarina sp.]MCH8500784.1 DUF1275 domain-containing protein [Aliidiomarina sp.]
MVSRLPKWVEYGAFILALVAGFVNAVGLLGFQHQSISHLSGITTLIGTGLATNSLWLTAHLAGIVAAFVIGAAISGFFLRSGALKMGRNYSGLLAVEGTLLLAAIAFLNQDSSIGHYFASAACGLQNAMVTTYSGAVIRTTHVTGIFTDIGIMIGAKLRGEPFDSRKALLFALIVTGFIVGGSFGAVMFSYFTFNALYVPVMICALLAVSYRWYKQTHSD